MIYDVAECCSLMITDNVLYVLCAKSGLCVDNINVNLIVTRTRRKGQWTKEREIERDREGEREGVET